MCGDIKFILSVDQDISRVSEYYFVYYIKNKFPHYTQKCPQNSIKTQYCPIKKTQAYPIKKTEVHTHWLVLNLSLIDHVLN